jgi:glycerol kinase
MAPYFIHAQNSSSEQKYRAIIDSIAFLLVNNIEAIQQVSVLTKLYVSGGLSRLDGLCQRLADLSRLPVHRLAQTEATARGAAWLANHCPAHWPGPESDKTFLAGSSPELARRYREFFAQLNGL